MLEHLLLGGGFAFAAVVQPGPLQAFLLARATSEGWRRTLPAAFAPVLSDGPIAALVLLLLGQLSTAGQQALRAAGGVLLLYLAWGALRDARAASARSAPATTSSPRTLLQAVTVNLLNPNPYIGWSLVMGPAAVAAWRQGAMHAVALVAAFYGVMVVGLATFIVLASTARLLPPPGQRTLALLSAAVLAALGVWLLAGVPAGAQERSGSVPRDGFRLHYRVVGARGPDVVVLSGGPGLDVDDMASVAERLQGTYRVVFLEQRGTGRSTFPTLDERTLNWQGYFSAHSRRSRASDRTRRTPLVSTRSRHQAVTSCR